MNLLQPVIFLVFVLINLVSCQWNFYADPQNVFKIEPRPKKFLGENQLNLPNFSYLPNFKNFFPQPPRLDLRPVNGLQKISNAIVEDIKNLSEKVTNSSDFSSEQTQRFKKLLQRCAQIISSTSTNFIDKSIRLINLLAHYIPNIPGLFNGQIKIPQLFPKTAEVLSEFAKTLTNLVANFRISDLMPQYFSFAGTF